MITNLVLMRHGDAPYNSPSEGIIPDFDRALSETGKEQAAQAAKLIKEQVKIDLIISSHAPRSYDTAKYILQAFPEATFIQEDILYNGTQEQIKQFIWAICEVSKEISREVSREVSKGATADQRGGLGQFKGICLVGHNPTISSIAIELTNGGHLSMFRPAEFVIIRGEV